MQLRETDWKYHVHHRAREPQDERAEPARDEERKAQQCCADKSQHVRGAERAPLAEAAHQAQAHETDREGTGREQCGIERDHRAVYAEFWLKGKKD